MKQAGRLLVCGFFFKVLMFCIRLFLNISMCSFPFDVFHEEDFAFHFNTNGLFFLLCFMLLMMLLTQINRYVCVHLKCNIPIQHTTET